MCLAVPGTILAIDENDVAEVDFFGVKRSANVSMVEAGIGNHVIVHAGFAIQVLSCEEAAEGLDLFRQMVEEQNA